METLDIAGVSLDVHMAGSGPPLLFLHAGQFVGATGPFLAALARGHRVIAPRHPGYGKAPVPEDIRSIDDLAYLYLDLADKLGLEQATLVGASLGGWIGLEMAVRDPRRFKRTALIAPVGVKLASREERDFADVFYLPEAEASATLFANPKRFAPNLAELPVAEVEALARERQMLAYYGWKPYLHNPGLKRWLHRIPGPTLLVWGENDRFASPAYGRALAGRLPAAELKIVPGAGHFPAIEQPEAVAAAIAAFAKA
jgi:pimeloyl-ACP methyl ester carboxylesterase